MSSRPQGECERCRRSCWLLFLSNLAQVWSSSSKPMSQLYCKNTVNFSMIWEKSLFAVVLSFVPKASSLCGCRCGTFFCVVFLFFSNDVHKITTKQLTTLFTSTTSRSPRVITALVLCYYTSFFVKLFLSVQFKRVRERNKNKNEIKRNTRMRSID